VQTVLEREPHAQVGGQARGADDLSGPDGLSLRRRPLRHPTKGTSAPSYALIAQAGDVSHSKSSAPQIPYRFRERSHDDAYARNASSTKHHRSAG
jgi:hypothetical protein